MVSICFHVMTLYKISSILDMVYFYQHLYAACRHFYVWQRHTRQSCTHTYAIGRWNANRQSQFSYTYSGSLRYITVGCEMFPWFGLQTGVKMSGFSLLSGYVQSVSIQQPTEIQNFFQQHTSGRAWHEIAKSQRLKWTECTGVQDGRVPSYTALKSMPQNPMKIELEVPGML